MKKEDLEYGNVVELRNGDKYVYNICYGSGYLMCLNGRGSNPLDDYGQDLIIKFNFDHEFDIVKIYKDFTLKDLLWERKEKPILTDVERIVLENIDKEFKYIARDKNDRLYIHQNKPIKYSEFWSDDNCRRDFCFDNLLLFIIWKDEEPYSIEELLKGE